MRLRSIALLLLATPLASCDRGSTPPGKILGQGILRLTPAATVPPEIGRDAAYRPGLPQLSLSVEYSGPKPCLRFRAEGFESGKSRAETEDIRAIGLPLRGELAFALGEGKNSEGKLLTAIIERFPGTSNPATGLVSTRSGGVAQMPIEPIGQRKWKTYEAKWPLEVPDGNEIVVWGVFVGEPSNLKEDMQLMERARQAEAAWLFKVSTTELQKK